MKAPEQYAPLVIEAVSPCIDAGRYPVKRIVGDILTIEADLLKDGHDLLAAVVQWRPVGGKSWHESPMVPLENDRWSGRCAFPSHGAWELRVEAWPDPFLSWLVEFEKKNAAGFTDLKSETLEGAALLDAAAERAGGADAKSLQAAAGRIRAGTPEEVLAEAGAETVLVLMSLFADRSRAARLDPALPVWVDRRGALIASWYEFFPRSAEGLPDRGSTFRDCLPRVDDARAMGFDVIYFPPIHPIGLTKRKGANNSLESGPDDPGVPYAIGSKDGGHTTVAPELGTLEDFDWLVGEIHARGMEVALDFAINCSPDHPYVSEHPEWFNHRPDGSIKYAENPPKKYEDIYPLNFHCAQWRSLWEELRRVLIFWAEHGVRIFRVDNPHTKPVAFWEWVIAEVQRVFPDTIFLSEAFTRPKMMRVLAKAGFTQSYTYFTWRNDKAGLTEYLTELSQSEMRWYFRGNLFTNTPDILPVFLQECGRAGFMIRAALAATLSPVYGIYSGFELCENASMPGKEEYRDSEKYQFKGRDWNAPGNIKDFITKLNHIRRVNRAFWQYENLRFCPVANDQLLAFAKQSDGGENTILVVINLDPWNTQSGWVQVPLGALDFPLDEPFLAEDLLGGEIFTWRGTSNFVSLQPETKPVHILHLRKRMGRRLDGDVFA